MGASFALYQTDPDNWVSMSYGHVHVLRKLLLRPLRLEEMYADFMASRNDLEAQLKFDRITTALHVIQQADEGNDFAYGIEYFIDHSDCEDVFYSGPAGDISKAFEWALNEYETRPELKEGVDPAYFTTMEKMKKLFHEADESNGIVIIN